MCFVPQALNFTFHLSRPWDLTKPFPPGAAAFRNHQQASGASLLAQPAFRELQWHGGQALSHPRPVPSTRPPIPVTISLPGRPDPLSNVIFRHLSVLLLSPMSWTLQPPSSQTAQTLGIIRIFDNQNSVGWFQHSEKENGHHESVGSCNSQGTPMDQALPL